MNNSISYNGAQLIAPQNSAIAQAISENATVVCFCYNKRENDIFAVFPNEPANSGFRLSYAHIGQHSEASIAYIRNAEQATKKQYSDLLQELASIYTDGLLVVSKKEAGF